MLRQITLTGILFVFMTIASTFQPAQVATDEEIAVRLATLLRSAGAVLEKSQKHINDASIGDKGIIADMVVKTAKSAAQLVS